MGPLEHEFKQQHGGGTSPAPHRPCVPHVIHISFNSGRNIYHRVYPECTLENRVSLTFLLRAVEEQM